MLYMNVTKRKQGNTVKLDETTYASIKKEMLKTHIPIKWLIKEAWRLYIEKNH